MIYSLQNRKFSKGTKEDSLVCNHPIALEELCEAEKSVIKLLQDNASKGEIKMIQNRVIGGKELEQIAISSSSVIASLKHK